LNLVNNTLAAQKIGYLVAKSNPEEESLASCMVIIIDYALI
jgi:hypothetical protein